MTTTAEATSWLFVPGNRPDRFDKAVSSGADAVVIDLEDAVAPRDKASARAAALTWLRGGRAWVRVNGTTSDWYHDDVLSLAGAPGLMGIFVPKAEDPAVLADTHRHLGGEKGMVPLIENACGMARLAEIAGCPGVDRLAFGSIDFALDLGCSEEDDSLLLFRSMLVIASRVADKPAPIDGVTRKLDDIDATRRDAERAKALGFGGKLCIHPAQVSVVRASFRPTEQDARWAQMVVQEAASAAAGAKLSATGELIDKPVIERARRILAQVESP